MFIVIGCFYYQEREEIPSIIHISHFFTTSSRQPVRSRTSVAKHPVIPLEAIYTGGLLPFQG